MRIAGETVGLRGAALLGVTAVVGIVLGFHGWSGHGQGLPAGAIGGARPSASASAPASSAASQSATSAPSQGPTASPAPKPGPKLSAQSYAAYSFQVWPGAVSSAAQAAETGLSITVKRQGSGIMVTAGVKGQPPTAPVYYPTGVKVYVIEASMGDDSGNDFNLGDDGLVVTDAQGRILR